MDIHQSATPDWYILIYAYTAFFSGSKNLKYSRQKMRINCVGNRKKWYIFDPALPLR
jgi:hypothetical protein